MTSRALLVIALSIAAGACAKKSQETDALSPPPSQRGDTTTARMERPDSSQIRSDTTHIRNDSTRTSSDSVRRDSTSTTR
jgi:hypothetical protein